ncbi:predicted protein [Botrytis cinerea T4]|uniref:Uncharacterized protein n=1 Tax=Botryotinia fuckeliana (strain T4) TaxID=999810 RepID=G2YD29_BOTF4|nr:predicted protein [Botrytis cinerea T4]
MDLRSTSPIASKKSCCCSSEPGVGGKIIITQILAFWGAEYRLAEELRSKKVVRLVKLAGNCDECDIEQIWETSSGSKG